MTDHTLPPITGNGEQATVKLSDYIAAVRAGDLALNQERDRRYAEVSIEREKALKIKEKADEKALSLARDIQTYKDLQANQLREQINNERGLYATKDQLDALAARHTEDVNRVVSRLGTEVAALRDYFDALHRPVIEFMATYRGGSSKRSEGRLDIGVIVQVLAFLAAAGAALIIALKK